MKYLLKFYFLGLLLIATSCEKSEVTAKQDYKDILTNLSNNVIIETYKDLDDQTIILVANLVNFQSDPTSESLEKARQAWRDARQPWEQSEGFLFGPVDQKGLDPAIDSWPVNQPDLDAVLNSPNTLSKSYVNGLDGTLKGFHTIEYLLFGVDANKAIADFTPRQLEYLIACAESLNEATQTLYYSWRSDKQNFVANVIDAGKAGNSVYPSQKSALEELVNGMVTIADEVANGKINEPLSQQNINLEESRFSKNSKSDFANNIRSIKNAYIGTYKNANGLGMTTVIAAKNIALDIKIKKQIDEAIQSIEDIEGTFTSAIFNSKSSVEFAQLKVRTLQQTLESEILPIISNL